MSPVVYGVAQPPAAVVKTSLSVWPPLTIFALRNLYCVPSSVASNGLPVAAAGGVAGAAGTAAEPGFAGLSSTGLSFLPQAGGAGAGGRTEEGETNLLAPEKTP